MGRKKRHGNVKYDAKYARELEDGIRFYGYSVVELCQKWKINKHTYYRWIDTYPQFKAAHEQGKVDYEAFWQKQARKAALGELKGVNAAMMQFTLKNVDSENWKDRVEHVVEDKAVRRIEIEILPSHNQLEHKEPEKIIESKDYEVVENRADDNS